MTDPMTALVWAFLVRVGVCAVWLVSFVAVTAPVQAGIHDCGPALTAIQGGGPDSDCTYHAGMRVTAALLGGGMAAMAARPLLRRVDTAAGLAG